jgi:hypothetical protein
MEYYFIMKNHDVIVIVITRFFVFNIALALALALALAWLFARNTLHGHEHLSYVLINGIK